MSGAIPPYPPHASMAWTDNFIGNRYNVQTAIRKKRKARKKIEKTKGRTIIEKLRQSDRVGTINSRPVGQDTMSYLYIGNNKCFSCNETGSQKWRGRREGIRARNGELSRPSI
jgi:hypothetical protein